MAIFECNIKEVNSYDNYVTGYAKPFRIAYLVFQELPIWNSESAIELVFKTKVLNLKRVGVDHCYKR